MKNIKKLVLFASMLAASNAFASKELSSPRASIRCAFGYYGNVTFHVDLGTKKVKVDEDPDANSIAGRWVVKASFEKNGKSTRNVSTFRLTDNIPMQTIVLAGDNADDTDFILTMSYQGEKPVLVGNLQDFGTVFEESSTIHAKKCEMKFE